MVDYKKFEDFNFVESLLYSIGLMFFILSTVALVVWAVTTSLLLGSFVLFTTGLFYMFLAKFKAKKE